MKKIVLLIPIILFSIMLFSCKEKTPLKHMELTAERLKAMQKTTRQSVENLRFKEKTLSWNGLKDHLNLNQAQIGKIKQIEVDKRMKLAQAHKNCNGAISDCRKKIKIEYDFKTRETINNDISFAKYSELICEAAPKLCK